MRKTEINNPRYPHYLRIVRKVGKDWLDDDDNIVDLAGSNNETDEVADTGEIVVYEGVGRSYTETTTTGDKKVDTNKRKASIPVRFNEWSTLVPMSGDIVYVTKGAVTEEWEVKDFEPDNNRSVVYGEMNRNFNME
ncbi:hypothetical protein [Prevotella sp. E2-28]|uniref:hypothetical protein n=1 Tax=Prevotella sp. E2-28 TaxID=2913620 RepID=UPI001EDC20D5|nr:hypothetical protein [Prevotella sp. E2-28]UKK52668.1 hypothetical protein L6465_08620 [Prevotella sp. E2-28]